MDYSKANKAAWEEAFTKHQAGYKEDLALRLRKGDRSFLEADVIVELEKIGLVGKEVAQMCWHNGRELLNLLSMGAAKGTGFDISENFVGEAQRLARDVNLNAEFVATDIYDIEDKYNGQFDLVLITIGALCWFEDLGRFFEKVAIVLKENGTLLINEQHPYTNMLAMVNEEGYDPARPDKVVFSYFKEEPWVDNDGVDYVGETTYASKTLYSFSHSFANVISALRRSNLRIDRLSEFDYDISTSWRHIDKIGMPLSYVLVAVKHSQ